MTGDEGSSGRTVGGDRAVLERLLGDPGLAWLVARARARVLDARGEPLSGVVRLADPSDEQRAAAVRLVGRPRRGGASLRVDLAVVEEVLRRGPWTAGLADAVETLGGPIRDPRADRAREAAAWDEAREELTSAIERFPQLAEWWEGWCTAGSLKRSARAEADRTDTTVTPAVGVDLGRRLATVLAALPATDQPLAVLARETVGDAHGLDASRPLGRLATAAVAAAFRPEGEDRTSGLSPRDVWQAAGVVLSNVASTVLCLGVPGAAPGTVDAPDRMARAATATSLEAMREARMPLVMTLDQVRSGGVGVLPADALVHVCENPTVVEVVARRWMQSEAGGPGTPAPVVVCTGGQPSTAVVELLAQLTYDGAECRYHGDFDWPGLRIATSLGVGTRWVPWRFATEDYRAAVRDGKPSRPLTGTPASSPWDPDLAVAMAEAGLTIEEEAVADLLASDVLAPGRGYSGAQVALRP